MLNTRILDVMSLVENDNIVINWDLHRLTYPRINQVIVRAKDDLRLLRHVARSVIWANPNATA
jgi:hypothetical protein